MIHELDLSTQIDSIHLSNPLLLASGIMDEDAGSIKRILDAGAAGVVTKSIGVNPNPGHPNPTFVELPYGILNAMGLPNPGIDSFVSELDFLQHRKKPIIGSIYGKNETEFKKLARLMASHGANALELNLSCPHAEGFGLELGQDPDMVKKVTHAVKKQVKIPVFVKLSSNVNNIIPIAQAAEEANADAVVAINTVKAMVINLEIEQPVLAHKTGGYSGKAIKPIGIRCVYDLYRNINLPIVGVGGITTAEDVIEYMMAGACAIEIGTAVYYRGVTLFQELTSEIGKWMHAHNYTNLNDLIGVAH